MNNKVLNKEALRQWILSKMISLTNNMLATTPGVSAMDAAQGPVIQGEIDEINSNIGVIPQFVVDPDTGKITGYKTKEGADTVHPFRGGEGDVAYKINCTLSCYADAQNVTTGNTIRPSSGVTYGYIVIYGNSYKVYGLSVSGDRNGSGGNAYIAAKASLVIDSIEAVDPNDYF